MHGAFFKGRNLNIAWLSSTTKSTPPVFHIC